jgi:hypothetical protein
MLAARQIDNPDESRRALIEATQELIQNSRQVISSETEEFFGKIKILQPVRKQE